MYRKGSLKPWFDPEEPLGVGVNSHHLHLTAGTEGVLYPIGLYSYRCIAIVFDLFLKFLQSELYICTDIT